MIKLYKSCVAILGTFDLIGTSKLKWGCPAVENGTPQGSVIGPLFFSTVITDVFLEINRSLCLQMMEPYGRIFSLFKRSFNEQ